MAAYPESKLLEVSRQFQIYGDLLHAEPCKIGHINETYIATYNQGGVQVRYVHQKINTQVFTDPDAVMDNFTRVTSHQRRKLVASGARDASRRTLTVIPTRDGRAYYRNGGGECWRTLVFVDRTTSCAPSFCQPTTDSRHSRRFSGSRCAADWKTNER